MKIKNKLTLLFTLLIAILLIAINFYIYSVSKSYSSNQFFQLLRERAYAAANVYLEEDEVSKKIFEGFQKKYLERLPGETIRVYDSLDHPAFIADSVYSSFSKSIIDKTRKATPYEGRENGKYIYGIYYLDNQGDFVILVSAVDKIGDARLNHLRNVLLIGFIISLIIVFFIGRFFTKLMLEPISGIIKHVNSITETNLNQRLDEGNGRDELAELAITFNTMLARIENAFILQQNFVANASHELRTPLTSIIGNIDVALSRDRSTNDYKIVLNTILEETERLHKLTDGLLNIAQANFDTKTLKVEPIRIDELLEEAKDLVHYQVPEGTMELEFENMPDNAEELLIEGNKNLLLIAIVNIVENAHKFSDNKLVKINLSFTPTSVDICIKDTGIGIPEKDMQNISQTFFRAENARRFNGSGIGLSLSRKILQLHNGKLMIKSEVGKGTTITIQFQKNKMNKTF